MSKLSGSKRSRSPDPQTAALIESIQEGDALEDIETRFKHEKAAIEHDNSLAIEDIRKEFKTLDPESLEGRAKLRLKQKLEFQNGLHTDRLRVMETERSAETNKHHQVFKKRKKSRHIDDVIRKCSDIAETPAKDSCYKMLGKSRHVQHLLKKVSDQMNQEQRDKYDVLMEDLKKNGWKVFLK
jgi:hypothetical protein